MTGLNELKGFLFEGANQQSCIIIYAPKITTRLRYVCKFIFNQGFLINFSLTDIESEFLGSKLPKLNYSGKTFEAAHNIFPSGLLNETKLQEVKPSELDLFSFVFYHISRYEEWISKRTDEHGRFVPEKINEVPAIDILILAFKKELLEKFKSLQFPERKFKFVSTIDVDNVYAYKAKSFIRQIGGGLKDLKNLRSRIDTVLFEKKDPFDEYDLQVELSQKYNIPLIYFFLYRNNAKYDRTIDPDHPDFIKLLKQLKENKITIGLHPSYDSSSNYELLKQEQHLLSKNSETEVNCSRQHYLRFNIKTTPKELIKAGIRYDFTMGFADKIGFRASTTLPFYYYDIETESELNLLAVPFCAMDGAFYIHKNISATESFNAIMSLANRVKDVNGLFITVIHDRSFSNAIAPGWKDLYIKLHESLKN